MLPERRLHGCALSNLPPLRSRFDLHSYNVQVFRLAVQNYKRRALHGRAFARATKRKEQRFPCNARPRPQLQMYRANSAAAMARQLLLGDLDDAHGDGEFVHDYMVLMRM
jgi:hypothetical protein